MSQARGRAKPNAKPAAQISGKSNGATIELSGNQGSADAQDADFSAYQA